MASSRHARQTVAILAALLWSAPVSGVAAPAQGWICDSRSGAIEVATAAEFRDALSRIEPGGTIALSPGRYDRLAVRDFHRSGFVTVRSADPARPAEIGALNVARSDHLWFQQLRFAIPEPSSRAGSYIVTVDKSQDIAIVASEFHGSVDGDYGNDPSGARFLLTDRMVFAANRLHDLTRGLVVGGVRQARVSGNRFENLRTDGANFAGVQNVLIDGNLFTTFHPNEKDHPDFIQFWQRNALIENTFGVRILQNTFLQGRGSPTQTIFIGNKIEGRVYRDFVIEDNVIYNSHPHGISLYDLEGGRVQRNTLVAFPDGNRTFPGGKYAPRINLFHVRDVTVAANVAPGVAKKDVQDIRMDDNMLTGLDAYHSARHLERLFRDPDARANAATLSFMPRPGGALDLPEDRRIGALSGTSGASRTSSPNSAAKGAGEYRKCS